MLSSSSRASAEEMTAVAPYSLNDAAPHGMSRIERDHLAGYEPNKEHAQSGQMLPNAPADRSRPSCST